ncbi:MAG: hypothetical protein H0U55_09610 [Rubrobacteraceae bacterium]|nr:hypothetical protein [Rubrobacteraceae bacterium]
MKRRIATLAMVLTVMMASLAVPAFAAQASAAQTNSGTQIKIESPSTPLSGTAGQYVNLPATITNTSDKPVKDVVAYVTLVETTSGQQAPVDLEDWSAHRAVTFDSLSPGETKNASWDLRLIKGGEYIVYAAAIAKDSSQAAVGPEVPLSVTAQKNLNPGGVLPVALGVPMVAGAALFVPVFWRRRHFTA